MEDDTRAEIARRRLAALAADFDRRYSAEPPDDDTVGQVHASPAAPVAPAESPGRHAAQRPETRVRWSLSTWHVRVIIAVTAAAVVLIAGWVMTSRPNSSQAVPSATISAETDKNATDDAESDKASADSELIIDVAGKVKKPGIVELPAGSRVIDAIKAAGGAKPKADTTALNLARQLNDGEQILVGVDQPAGDPGDDVNADQSGRKVNVNTASSEELQTLPGIGPATAQAIIDFRTENGGFTSVDDLLDVKGIGPVTLEDIKDRVNAG